MALPDGTTKQRNPFTGTQVWTVPGRGNRPLASPTIDARPLLDGEERRFCAFCSERYLDTPPEKSRVVNASGTMMEVKGLMARELQETVAEFRRIPNLFEILPLHYWTQNHGFEPPAEDEQRARDYVSDEAGERHLTALVEARAKAAGIEKENGLEEIVKISLGWFSSGHELVVPRRHFVEEAVSTDQLASSGTLAVEEHRQYLRMTLDAMAHLYRANSHVRYVATFQNWLKPAGASFDHLHKQVVAIDEHGQDVEAIAAALARDANACNVLGLDIALEHGLVLAENDHAVAWVGFGHRYPTVEVWSRSSRRPWEQSDEQVAAMSDLVHAMHAASGPEIPCNEEWTHRPPDVAELVPWRVEVVWRISTLAGFEGSTGIYLNTISPWSLRDRLLPKLRTLRQQGAIADVRLGDECDIQRGALPTSCSMASP